ncbi:MAG: hypothetical protein Q9220_006364 [cf. Caloplaca sp. 1 TL-2023]
MRSAIDNSKVTKSRRLKTKNRKSAVKVGDVPVDREHGQLGAAEDLADFVDYVANEIFESFSQDLQSLSYSVLQKDPRLAKEFCDPLPKATADQVLIRMAPSVADSLVTYGLLDSQDDLPKFLIPILQDYVNASTAPPPLWSTTRASACEICDRDWIPLSYHHLIPKQVHAKAIKREWHEEWQLNSVAWLCRACHSFVHRMASNEELATKYWTVERLMAKDDVQAWAKWVGRTSVLHDVCIFCTTRLQFASSRPTTRPQRRLLRSTVAAFRPPAQAAAAYAREEHAPSDHTPSSAGPTFGGGWGNASFSTELTPEELALRESMRRRRPPVANQEVLPTAQNQNPQSQGSSSHDDRRSNQPNKDFRVRVGWTCSNCTIVNGQNSSVCGKCNKSKSATAESQRRCSSCGWHTPGSASRCERCDTFIVDEAQMTRMAQDWKHVQRNTQKSSAEDEARSPKSVKAQSLTPLEYAAKLNNDRKQRWENSRNARFVGLKSLNAQRNARAQGFVTDRNQPNVLSQGERPQVAQKFANQGPNEQRTRRENQPMTQDRQPMVSRNCDAEYRQKQQERFREPGVAERPRYSDGLQRQDSASPSVQTAPPANLGSGWGTYSSAEITLNESERSQRPLPDPKPQKFQVQNNGPEINGTVAVDSQSEALPKSNQSLKSFRAFKSSKTDSSADLSWLNSISPPRRVPSGRIPEPVREDTSRKVSNEWDAAYGEISMLEASSPRPSQKTLLRDRQREVDRLPQRSSSFEANEPGWKDRQAGQPPPVTSSNTEAAYAPGGQPSRNASEYEQFPRQSTRDRPQRSRDDLQDAKFARSARQPRFDSSPYVSSDRRRSRPMEDDFDEDTYDEDREESRQRRKEQRKKEKAAQKRSSPPTPIYLPEFISVGNLARALRVRVEDFTKKMKGLGFEETNNDHLLDAEVAGLIAAEFNFEPILDKATEGQDLQARPLPEDKSLLPSRPPIVTIMGHVDHGKTTLLDYLRKSSVAASEHGGITQHIGAFSVSMPGGRLITFLDTPGHAAFLSMRQRGANVTDIVILVVAADDSVKPQTIEAIKHAQAAKVPMIVAINKIDKEDKNIDRVKQDLARYGVEIEDFGGDTQVVCVSGKTGQGLDELEDAAVALADILDMRAETDGQSEGWVLEATTKKAGRVATVLVRRGTIRRGDFIVAGSTWAKIRTLKNEAGVQVSHAGPGTPVEVDGWKDQPSAGDEVLQATSEQQAKSVVEFRLAKVEKEQMAADMTAVNESRRLEQEKRDAATAAAAAAAASASGSSSSPDTSSSSSATSTTDTSPQQPAPTPPEQPTTLTLPLLLKADVSGSLEACTNALTALGHSTCHPHILRSSVGPLSESDIVFASASAALIVNFNQITAPDIMRMMEREGVGLVEENVIYRLSDAVKGHLEELLPRKVEVRVVGEAEVQRGFEIGVGGRRKMGVAGCRVRNGVVGRGGKVKVVRGEEVVFSGILTSLKSLKKDVDEMRKGNECGIAFEGGWQDFREGDQVQCFEEKEVRQTL